jgi:hypothetical protein
MGANIQEENVAFFYSQNQYYPMGVRETHRMLVAVLAAQPMQAQPCVTRVVLELLENILQHTHQVRMPAKEPPGRSEKGLRPYKLKPRHPSVP